MPKRNLNKSKEEIHPDLNENPVLDQQRHAIAMLQNHAINTYGKYQQNDLTNMIDFAQNIQSQLASQTIINKIRDAQEKKKLFENSLTKAGTPRKRQYTKRKSTVNAKPKECKPKRKYTRKTKKSIQSQLDSEEIKKICTMRREKTAPIVHEKSFIDLKIEQIIDKERYQCKPANQMDSQVKSEQIEIAPVCEEVCSVVAEKGSISGDSMENEKSVEMDCNEQANGEQDKTLTNSQIDNDIKFDIESKKKKCVNEFISFTDEEHIRIMKENKIIQIINPTKDKPLACKKCYLVFKNAEFLCWHILSHHRTFCPVDCIDQKTLNTMKMCVSDTQTNSTD
ncbi:hypothetical protein A3Q56_00450 [Intoshia linei]|uniref:Uncharacterized protein n=1 Tax=Intoshia linei TaxID=1819745 RepID=A0A177BC33_9BILA|nr:hypothetical protein A3Q56_00450 [Intoshia linei]